MTIASAKHKTNVQTFQTNDIEAAMKLQQMSLTELQHQASEMGIELASQDKSKYIDAIINAGVGEDKLGEPGMLFSLHSRTPEAEKTILEARNVILHNQEAKRTFVIWLKNSKGDFYSQRVAGCRVTTPERLQAVKDLVVLADNGTQDAIFEDFEANPESYETPLLVKMLRVNSDKSRRNYVMLFLKKKQDLVEKGF